MSVPIDGEAPQKSAATQKTTAYYVGTTIRSELRYHTFIKNFSNRGAHGTGDPFFFFFFFLIIRNLLVNGPEKPVPKRPRAKKAEIVWQWVEITC